MQLAHPSTVLLALIIPNALASQAQSQHPDVHYSASFSGQQQEYKQQKPVMAGSASKNVLKTPLTFFSLSPPTGFLRTGYCEAPPSDTGNHSVAAEVTEEFLTFSAARGNDLRAAGLKGGCKWCLCASRWREAFDARGSEGDKVVPRVWMGATHERALERVGREELEMFAVKE